MDFSDIRYAYQNGSNYERQSVLVQLKSFKWRKSEIVWAMKEFKSCPPSLKEKYEFIQNVVYHAFESTIANCIERLKLDKTEKALYEVGQRGIDKKIRRFDFDSVFVFEEFYGGLKVAISSEIEDFDLDRRKKGYKPASKKANRPVEEVIRFNTIPTAESKTGKSVVRMGQPQRVKENFQDPELKKSLEEKNATISLKSALLALEDSFMQKMVYLTPDEQVLVTLACGFKNHQAMEFDCLASKFGVSEKKIKQNYAFVISKLLLLLKKDHQCTEDEIKEKRVYESRKYGIVENVSKHKIKSDNRPISINGYLISELSVNLEELPEKERNVFGAYYSLEGDYVVDPEMKDFVRDRILASAEFKLVEYLVHPEVLSDKKLKEAKRKDIYREKMRTNLAYANKKKAQLKQEKREQKGEALLVTYNCSKEQILKSIKHLLPAEQFVLALQSGIVNIDGKTPSNGEIAGWSNIKENSIWYRSINGLKKVSILTKDESLLSESEKKTKENLLRVEYEQVWQNPKAYRFSEDVLPIKICGHNVVDLHRNAEILMPIEKRVFEAFYGLGCERMNVTQIAHKENKLMTYISMVRIRAEDKLIRELERVENSEIKPAKVRAGKDKVELISEEKIMPLLKHFSPSDQYFLNLYWGVDGRPCLTTTKIAEKTGKKVVTVVSKIGRIRKILDLLMADDAVLSEEQQNKKAEIKKTEYALVTDFDNFDFNALEVKTVVEGHKVEDLARNLDCLNVKEKAIFKMCFGVECEATPVDEIAKMLNCSLNMVLNYRRMAVLKLVKKLESEGELGRE